MTTSMVNIGSVLTPNLTSPNQIGGTVIRCPDRIHLAPGAGVLVAPMVFTAAWERGAAHRTTHPILAPAEIPFPPSQPEWYNKLHC